VVVDVLLCVPFRRCSAALDSKKVSNRYRRALYAAASAACGSAFVTTKLLLVEIGTAYSGVSVTLTKSLPPLNILGCTGSILLGFVTALLHLTETGSSLRTGRGKEPVA
jgi:hypothetical protein